MDSHYNGRHSSNIPNHPRDSSPPPPRRQHSRPNSPQYPYHRGPQSSSSSSQHPPPSQPLRDRSRERERDREGGGFTKEPPRGPRALYQHSQQSPGPASGGFGSSGSGPPSAGFSGGGMSSGHRGSYSSGSGPPGHHGHYQGPNRPPVGPRAGGRNPGLSPTSSSYPSREREREREREGGPFGGGGRGISPLSDRLRDRGRDWERERERDYHGRGVQNSDFYRQGRPRSPSWNTYDRGRREGFGPDPGYSRGRSRERPYDGPYGGRPRSRERIDYPPPPRLRSRSRDRERDRLPPRDRDRSPPPLLRPKPERHASYHHNERDRREGWDRGREPPPGQRNSLERERPQFSRDGPMQSPPPPPEQSRYGSSYQSGPGGGPPPPQRTNATASQWAPASARRGSQWGPPLQNQASSDNLRDRARERDDYRGYRRPEERPEPGPSPTSPNTPASATRPKPPIREEQRNRAPSAPPPNVAIPPFPLSAPAPPPPAGPRGAGQPPPFAPTGPRNQSQAPPVGPRALVLDNRAKDEKERESGSAQPSPALDAKPLESPAAPKSATSAPCVHPDRMKLVEGATKDERIQENRDKVRSLLKGMSDVVNNKDNAPSSSAEQTGEGWAVPAVPNKPQGRPASPVKPAQSPGPQEFRSAATTNPLPSPSTASAPPAGSPPANALISPTKQPPIGPKGYVPQPQRGRSFNRGRGGHSGIPPFGRSSHIPNPIKREPAAEDDRREWLSPGRPPPGRGGEGTFGTIARRLSSASMHQRPSSIAPSENGSIRAESEPERAEPEKEKEKEREKDKEVVAETAVAEQQDSAPEQKAQPEPEPAVTRPSIPDEDSDDELEIDDIAGQLEELDKQKQELARRLQRVIEQKALHEEALKAPFVPRPASVEPEAKEEAPVDKMEVDGEESEEKKPVVEPRPKSPVQIQKQPVEDEDVDMDRDNREPEVESQPEPKQEKKTETKPEPEPEPEPEKVEREPTPAEPKTKVEETPAAASVPPADEDVEMTRAPTPRSPSLPKSPENVATEEVPLFADEDAEGEDDDADATDDEIPVKSILPFFVPGPQKPFAEMDFFRQNLIEHERLKPYMVARMELQERQDEQLTNERKDEYLQKYTKYVQDVRALEQNEQQRKQKGKGEPDSNISTPAATSIDAPPPTRRGGRSAPVGDVVRSEAEFEQVIRDIQEKEEQEKAEAKYKSEGPLPGEAVVPDMILSETEIKLNRFKDYNNLIRDKSMIPEIFVLRPPPDDFTEEEQKIFIERYLETPKQWGQIAKGLPGRTFGDCILHYYRTKQEANYKALVRGNGKGKRKGKRGRAAQTTRVRNALTAELDKKDEDADSEEVPMTEAGRPRRAAAPVFGNGEVITQQDRTANSTPLPTTGKRGNASRNGDDDSATGERQSKRTRGASTREGKGRRRAATATAPSTPAAPIVPAAESPAPQPPQFQLQNNAKLPILPPQAILPASQQQQQQQAIQPAPQHMQPPASQTPQHAAIDASPIRVQQSPAQQVLSQQASPYSIPVDRAAIEQEQELRQRMMEQQWREDQERARLGFIDKHSRFSAASSVNASPALAPSSGSGPVRTLDLLERETDAVSALADLMGNGDDVKKVKQEEGAPLPPTAYPPHMGDGPHSVPGSVVPSLAPSAPQTPQPGHQMLPGGAQITPTKKERASGASSSYWSVQEVNDFPRLLQTYGTQWNKIADHYPLKTTVMVRNYYTRQVENGKLDWRELAEGADKRRHEGQPPIPLHKSVATTSRKKEQPIQAYPNSRASTALEIREDLHGSPQRIEHDVRAPVSLAPQEPILGSSAAPVQPHVQPIAQAPPPPVPAAQATPIQGRAAGVVQHHTPQQSPHYGPVAGPPIQSHQTLPVREVPSAEEIRAQQLRTQQEQERQRHIAQASSARPDLIAPQPISLANRAMMERQPQVQHMGGSESAQMGISRARSPSVSQGRPPISQQQGLQHIGHPSQPRDVFGEVPQGHRVSQAPPAPSRISTQLGPAQPFSNQTSPVTHSAPARNPNVDITNLIHSSPMRYSPQQQIPPRQPSPPRSASIVSAPPSNVGLLRQSPLSAGGPLSASSGGPIRQDAARGMHTRQQSGAGPTLPGSRPESRQSTVSTPVPQQAPRRSNIASLLNDDEPEPPKRSAPPPAPAPPPPPPQPVNPPPQHIQHQQHPMQHAQQHSQHVRAPSTQMPQQQVQLAESHRMSMHQMAPQHHPQQVPGPYQSHPQHMQSISHREHAQAPPPPPPQQPHPDMRHHQYTFPPDRTNSPYGPPPTRHASPPPPPSYSLRAHEQAQYQAQREREQQMRYAQREPVPPPREQVPPSYAQQQQQHPSYSHPSSDPRYQQVPPQYQPPLSRDPRDPRDMYVQKPTYTNPHTPQPQNAYRPPPPPPPSQAAPSQQHGYYPPSQREYASHPSYSQSRTGYEDRPLPVDRPMDRPMAGDRGLERGIDRGLPVDRPMPIDRAPLDRPLDRPMGLTSLLSSAPPPPGPPSHHQQPQGGHPGLAHGPPPQQGQGQGQGQYYDPRGHYDVYRR